MALSCDLGAWTSVRLIHGLALLGHTPPAALLSDITTRLNPSLDWLTPWDQATLLASLASLGYSPPGPWLHRFLQCSQSKLPGLTGPAAAQLASALLRWDVCACVCVCVCVRARGVCAGEM